MEEIKERIREFNLTYVWLINEIGRTHNIVTDKTEMSSVLSGVRHGSKADLLIRAANEVLDEYERYYFGRSE